MMIKVSVCISVYNGAKFLGQQLLSIANQSFLPDEVIVYDDFSADESLLVIEEYSHILNIRLLHGKKRLGVLNGFLESIKYASGELIFFCDQDDVWDRNKVLIHTAWHQKGFNVVIGDCKIVDENMNTINESYQCTLRGGRGFWGNLVRSKFLGCCMSFDKRTIDIIGLPPKIYKGYHDWWYGLLSTLIARVVFINEKLVLYRRHENTVTPSGKKSLDNIIQKVNRRINLLLGLLIVAPSIIGKRFFNAK